MLEILKEYFFPCFINILTSIYISAELFGCKIRLKEAKTYFVIFALVVIAILNFLYVDNFFRLLVITLAIFCGNYLLFGKSIKLTIITSLINQLIVIVSELFVMLFTMIFFKADSNIIINEYYGNMYSNLSISLMMILISKFKLTVKIYNFIIKSTTKINYNTLVISILLLFISINVIVFSIYSNVGIVNIFIINFFFLFIYCIIFFISMSERNANVKYKQEREMLINNLNQYEKMLDYQRVNNHENKNQLLVIKSMIEKKDEKTLDYINEIIKDKREDNEILYTKAKRIPSGGLQGLIYQKMLLGQENKIRFNLNVSKDIRKIDIFEENSKLNYDICRIIGIVLDNAIEEVVKLNRSEREILISMYIDEYFIIEVSNHFIGSIDFEKIYSKGYTTKSKGHGYGLSLLKKIVDENENIINEKQVLDDIFTQIIKIKM